MIEPKNDYDVFYNTLHIRMASIAELMNIMSKSVNKRWKIDKKREEIMFQKLSEEEQKLVLNDGKKIKNLVFDDVDEDLSTNAKKIMSDLAHRHLYNYIMSMNICEMGVVSLVAFFEHFLREILGIVFKVKPEQLKSGQKDFSNEELFKFQSTAELKEAIIDSKTRSILRDDIDDVSDYLKKTFKYDITKNKRWFELRECIYRRNVIIHNNGVPDEIYSQKTNYSGPDYRLNTNDEYLGKCLFAFTECSKSLCIFLSKKFPSNTLET